MVLLIPAPGKQRQMDLSFETILVYKDSSKITRVHKNPVSKPKKKGGWGGERGMEYPTGFPMWSYGDIFLVEASSSQMSVAGVKFHKTIQDTWEWAERAL